MTKIKKLLNEEFKDSIVATEHMEKIQEMLSNKNLEVWAKETDKNYRKRSHSLLKAAIAAYDKFYDEVSSGD